jgi:hypothetical protein
MSFANGRNFQCPPPTDRLRDWGSGVSADRKQGKSTGDEPVPETQWRRRSAEAHRQNFAAGENSIRGSPVSVWSAWRDLGVSFP